MLAIKAEAQANAEAEGVGVDVRVLAKTFEKLVLELEYLASEAVNNKGAYTAQMRQEGTELILGNSSMEYELGVGQIASVTEGKKRKRGANAGGSYFDAKDGFRLVAIAVQCASLGDDDTTTDSLNEFFAKFPGKSERSPEEKGKRVRCSKGQASIGENVIVKQLKTLESNLNKKAGGSAFGNIIGIGYAAMIFQLPGNEHITYVVKDEEALVSAVKELAKSHGYSERG